MLFQIDFTETDDNWDDPSNKLWSIYMTAAEKHDTALTESWKVDTDGTLIFVSQATFFSFLYH